jgi:hypothetical protein
MQAQLTASGYSHSALFATSQIIRRKSGQFRAREEKDPGFLVADVVAMLSLATTVGIVIYMVLGMH